MFISKQDFINVFGYSKIQKVDNNRKDKILLNVFRGLGYLPIVGVVLNTAITVFLAKGKEKSLAKAFGLRAVGSLLPGVLPLADLVATVWKFKQAKSKMAPNQN